MKRILILGIVVLFLQSFVYNAVSAGNDFIAVDMRTDTEALSNAYGYRVWLGASGKPYGNFPTFTTSWISINLNDDPGLFGHAFTQVGIMTDVRGVFWFVYSELGVVCQRGSYGWWNWDALKYLGCKGQIEDLVGFDTLHRFELVTYYGENFWTARVYDEYDNAYDVARFPTTYKQIYDADVVMEEGYAQITDPYEYGSFYMYHPQYEYNGNYQDWPVTVYPSVNQLRPYPLEVCPTHYSATINLIGNPRFWHAGSNSAGQTCFAAMFPATDFFYLPLVIK
jgi:hypothetical protein